MRLVLCDDHRLFLESLAAALSAHGHNVVTTTRPGDAVVAVERSDADVCVLDMGFPEGSGLDAALALRGRSPGTRVMMLSASVEPDVVTGAVEAGAAGFVRKDQPLAVVIRAVEKVAKGGTAFDSTMLRGGGRGERAGEPETQRLLRYLSPREREVLRHLIKAHDTTQIARHLKISPSTARSHIQNVLVKLGVHSRLQAVTLIARAGLDGDL